MKENRNEVCVNLSHREIAILVIAAAIAGAAYSAIPDTAKVVSLPINLLVPLVISALGVLYVVIDKRKCASSIGQKESKQDA